MLPAELQVGRRAARPRPPAGPRGCRTDGRDGWLLTTGSGLPAGYGKGPRKGVLSIHGPQVRGTRSAIRNAYLSPGDRGRGSGVIGLGRRRAAGGGRRGPRGHSLPPFAGSAPASIAAPPPRITPPRGGGLAEGDGGLSGTAGVTR